MTTDHHIQEVIEHENQFWSRVFKDELEKEKTNKGDFSSYWWQLYYNEINKYVQNRLARYSNPNILEAGSGSGKASILLGKEYNRTLLDISEKALEYAQHLVEKFKVENVVIKQGNIFSIPFNDKSFDFTWNLGVIEHYDADQVASIFREMIRVTSEHGQVAIGVPNFKSIQIMKASLLRHPFLRWVPGYRLESEQDYKEDEIASLIRKAAKAEKREVIEMEVVCFGNPLPMETPRLMIRVLGGIIEKIFKKRKFLVFVVCVVK